MSYGRRTIQDGIQESHKTWRQYIYFKPCSSKHRQKNNKHDNPQPRLSHLIVIVTSRCAKADDDYWMKHEVRVANTASLQHRDKGVYA